MKTPFNLEVVTKSMITNLYSGRFKSFVNKTHKDLTKFGNRLVSNNILIQEKILEIGAGDGKLFKYVFPRFLNYYMTDISSWGAEDIENITKKDPRVFFEVQNIERLNYKNNFFDRVIISCVLAHVTEPFEALLEVHRVTKPGGVISLYVSADPGVLLRIMRKLFTERRMKNLGMPYQLYNAIEHRNTPISILNIIRFVFKESKIEVKYYPFRVNSWNLSTHLIVNIIKN